MGSSHVRLKCSESLLSTNTSVQEMDFVAQTRTCVRVMEIPVSDADMFFLSERCMLGVGVTLFTSMVKVILYSVVSEHIK